MEWVETTGSTIEEAKEVALDQLGVDESDAEFDVLEEPKSGLFGRLRSEARVRARVRPTTPRPKAERKERKRRAPKEEVAPAAEPAPKKAAAKRAPAKKRAAAKDSTPETETETTTEAPATATARPRGRGRAAAPAAEGDGARRGPAPRAAAATRRADADVEEEEATLAEQGEAVREFLDGLVEAFGLDGNTEIDEVDDETLEARVVGDDLGLLIGPKGQTLNAVQELARTIVMKGPGRGARVRVDVGGYRERRREALERFTKQIAEQVLDTGQAVALEPMSPPDRKIVHDTANTIDGVSTVSEGEDARRRVVLMPDDEG